MERVKLDNKRILFNLLPAHVAQHFLMSNPRNMVSGGWARLPVLGPAGGRAGGRPIAALLKATDTALGRREFAGSPVPPPGAGTVWAIRTLLGQRGAHGPQEGGLRLQKLGGVRARGTSSGRLPCPESLGSPRGRRGGVA